jgi:hypothetical protein
MALICVRHQKYTIRAGVSPKWRRDSAVSYCTQHAILLDPPGASPIVARGSKQSLAGCCLPPCRH